MIRARGAKDPESEEDMAKRLLALFLAFGFLFGVVAALQAAPATPQKPIVYPGKKEPASTFNHTTHAAAKCNDCHPKLFKMKAHTTKFTMADITAGKSCGSCHDGKKAFSATDTKLCAKCHPKK